ncbi:MAG: putative multiple sugar transport system permease protein [Verrucomicrobiota bacterium]|jgi:putative multiple sugar transport system permease protein|nr:putative multiple sugar transport system permease protein [Verrucomicrobiota bacterium]
MSNVLDIIKKSVRQYGMLIALATVMILFQFLTNGVLFRPVNLTNLVLQNSYILILAVGMLLCTLTGNVDLAVGSVVAFVGAIAATVMVDYGIPSVYAIIIILLIGGLVGAWQGYWIAYVKIPAFIVTLAGMLIFRGLALVVLHGQSKGPFPPLFQSMSSGFIADPFNSDKHILTLLIGIIASVFIVISELRKRSKQREFKMELLPLGAFIAKVVFLVVIVNTFTVVFASYKGIPNVLVLLFVLVFIFHFITTKTIPGRHIYALGGNAKAAKLSGVKTERVMFWIYTTMGILSAVAGMVFAARLNVATPKAGTGFELDAIGACYVGGVAVMGGSGTVIGVIVGGLFMGVLNNGMSIMGVGIDWQQTIKGFVLLAAVAFDLYSKRKDR